MSTIIKRFGVSSTNPSIILTKSNSPQTFQQPSPLSFVSSDFIQLSYPAAGAGTADDWGRLGQLAMTGQLLVAPGSGITPGRDLIVVASGDILIPNSISGGAVNFILNENYFTFQNQIILIRSDAIATLSSSFSLGAGSHAWSITCNIFDNSSRSGIFTTWTVVIDGTSISGTGSSVNPPVDISGSSQSRLQLSLQAQFNGSLGVGDNFQIRATQYELQQIGPKIL